MRENRTSRRRNRAIPVREKRYGGAESVDGARRDVVVGHDHQIFIQLAAHGEAIKKRTCRTCWRGCSAAESAKSRGKRLRVSCITLIIYIYVARGLYR